MPNDIYNNVLITGGSGMLAQALIRALRARGIEPTAIARAELDIADPHAVAAVINRIKPTLILNCAAYTKVDAAEQDEPTATAVNATGAAYVARIAAANLARFVHFSTDFVFDGRARRPYRTNDQPSPVSAYGRSKLAGEHAIMNSDYDPIYLIIRTAWLYGPGGPNFVQTMLNAARAGKPLKVVNDQTGSPTFTHDLAEATLNLIDANARGTFHVTNSGQTTWFGLTRAILEEFDLKADLGPTTSAEWKQLRPNSAPRPAYSVLDCSDYERLSGKTLPGWRDALHRYRLALSSG